MIARRVATPAVLVVALCAGVAMSPPARAQAQSHVHLDDAQRGRPPATRLSGSFSVGSMIASAVSANGQPVAERAGGAFNPAATFGLDQRVVSWLALGAEARVGNWNSDWAGAAGYTEISSRGLTDLDAVVRFRSPAVSLFTRPWTFSLSPSIGFTWPDRPVRYARAVGERWSPQRGANAGAGLGAETWFGLARTRWKLGCGVGVDYIRHWLTLDATFTPVSDPAAAVSVRYHYVTDQLLFKMTFLVGL